MTTVCDFLFDRLGRGTKRQGAAPFHLMCINRPLACVSVPFGLEGDEGGLAAVGSGPGSEGTFTAFPSSSHGFVSLYLFLSFSPPQGLTYADSSAPENLIAASPLKKCPC